MREIFSDSWATRSRWRLLILFGLILACSAGESAAQTGRPVREFPPETYYECFRLLDHGDYVLAEEAFRTMARSGIRTSQGPWIDAICYQTMVGECYYHMGDLRRALEQYTNALRLYAAQSNWLLRVQFPPNLRARANPLRSPITWGTSQRRTAIASLPRRYGILQGTTDLVRVVQEGGALMPPELVLIDAHEIVRCTGLALRRRAEIMGRACAHDPLTEQLLTILAARPAPVNHWSQSWIDGLLGFAYLGAGRQNEAGAELTKSLQLLGQFDHALTPGALVELGKIAFHQQQYAEAANLFIEATYSAPWFEQYDVIAEALRWGALTHLVIGSPGIYPPLEPAIAWSRRERVTALEATLLTAQAQNAAELNQTDTAAALVDRARRAMNRSEMLRGAAGARLSYVAAVVAFQSGNLNVGEAAWKDVLAHQGSGQRVGSQRLLEISLVDDLVTSGRVTTRNANQLYADVLREPLPEDWTTNPVETLTTVLLPNLPAFEHWFNVALERNEIGRALEIADRIRRLRFYSSLPMGGRLLSLAWVLDAPQDSLPEAALLQRQDLFTRYPAYAAAAQQAAQLREDLSVLPLIPADAGALKAQQKLWSEWGSLSQRQEVMLREIALRREPAMFVFPPPLISEQLQSRLSPNQVVLAYFMTSRNQLHAFRVTNAGCEHWLIEEPGKLNKEISDLLKQFGQFDRNTPVDLALLSSSDWQATTALLWPKLWLKPAAGSRGEVQELIVVPDRFLWYLPFEALPIDTGSDKPAVRVRYTPTVSLALPDSRTTSTSKDTVVVVGKLSAADDTALGAQLVTDLRKVLENVTSVTSSLPAPSSVISALGKRTLVLHDTSDQVVSPYDWAPMAVDRDKPGHSLGQWLALPWGAPDQIILPGYHTAAEASLRKNATGDDVFLAACGLMGAGSRTILLSRWRTGGQTSFDLMREFVQELPFASAADAWQRSVELVRDRELWLDREPRVKAGDADVSIKAEHPFFWSGYMLIDRGALPKADGVE